MTTLLVDNYDSYTFNLFQLIATVSGQEPIVVQNDDFDADWDLLCKTLRPGKDFHQVVISPGPGSPHTPSDVGLSAGAAADASVPVFGVCLGHQLLAATFGASVVRGDEPMHGRVTPVNVLDAAGLFAGVHSPFEAVRYHSLVVQEDSLPESVRVTARSDDGAIMALAIDHGARVSVGVQFHPESICSEHGADLVRNFLQMSADFWTRRQGLQSIPAPGGDVTAPTPTPAPADSSPAAPQGQNLGAVCCDGHRVVVEPVTLFATGETAAAATSTEAVFEALFAIDESVPRSHSRFWLDSATRDLGDRSRGPNASAADPSQTRFSFMGNAQGPLAELVEFYVDPSCRAIIDSADHGRPPHELRTFDASQNGQWSAAHISETDDIFEFLAHGMEAKRHDAGFVCLETVHDDASSPSSEPVDPKARPLQDWDLPFPLAAGYVGFLGYGLRRFCGVKKTLPRRNSVSTDSADSDMSGVSQMASRKRPRSPCAHPKAGNDVAEDPLRSGAQTKTQCCDGDTHVPDASFLFADRLVAWDHDSGMCWLVTYDDGSSATQEAQAAWREASRRTLHRLAKDTLREGPLATQSTNVAAIGASGVVSVPRPSPSSSSSSNAALKDPLRSTVEDAGYMGLIESCIEQIRAGETYEVCLTKQLSRDDDRVRPRAFDAYKMLRAANPAPYAAFFEVKALPGPPATATIKTPRQRGSDFAVCCSSPERFMRASAAGVVESKPIKGTIHRGATREEDAALAEELRTSVKDRAENLMIVDLVRNDLGKVCKVGSVHVPKLMQIESFTTVHQLVSTVRGQLDLDEDDFGQPHAPRAQRFPPTIRAIQAAFPGGSMTGAPKLRTMQIIDHLEPKERGVYSGALGFLSLTGASDLNIVIRTAVVTPAGISVGTGGAIVALSDAQGELDETKLKANRLQSVFTSFLADLATSV